MKRRTFLQRSTSTLAALGLSEVGMALMASRYRQVLAEPTRRKLALLVGINQYRNAPLSGGVTDVELQRELLIHRFGFQSADILTLTDQQATRSAIESAFLTHLIEQSQVGDVVVFHFSGYGSRVMVNPTNAAQTSLVTVDNSLTDGDRIVDDLLETTLLLLLRSLPTDKVTTILDTSYSNPGKLLQGNFRIRTHPSVGSFRPSAAELALQEHLLSQTSIERERVDVQRRSGQMRGVVLSATKSGLATEAKWGGFSAGLFTYALTQHLWQATSATVLRVSLGRTTEQVQRLNQAQQPQLSGQKSQEQPLLPYYLPPMPDRGAAGVVTAVDNSGKTVRLWLGGLPASVLEQYGANAVLTVNQSANQCPLLQVTSRNGLTAKAKLLTPAADTIAALQIGQFVREQVRILTRTVGLTVALDTTLKRIERVDAVSALSVVPRISATIAGDHRADYLFSQSTPPAPTASKAIPAAANSSSHYGLFSPGRDPIANTMGEGGEAVKAAVRRLTPKLQTLLAAKLLHLSANEVSGGVAVRATLEMLSPPRILLIRETRSPTQPLPEQQLAATTAETAGLVSLPVGSQIQYRLENRGSDSVYFIVLGLDSSGDLISLYSPPVRTPAVAQLPETAQSPLLPTDTSTSKTSSPNSERSIANIAPGETLTLPQASASFQWVLRKPVGLSETYLICSRAPFTQTLTVLRATQPPTSEPPDLRTLSNPLDVAQAVLQDLHQASSSMTPTIAATDAWALNVDAWASLRFVYQVV